MRVEVPVPVRICLLVAKRERVPAWCLRGREGGEGPQKEEDAEHRAEHDREALGPRHGRLTAAARHNASRCRSLRALPAVTGRHVQRMTVPGVLTARPPACERGRRLIAAGPPSATGQPLSEDDSPLAGSAFAPSALASAPTPAPSGAPCSTAPPPASPLSAAGGAPPSTAGPPIGSVCRLESTMAATTTPTASTVMPTRSHVLPAYVTTAGAISSATRFITLISGLIAGPAVSLNGSPTVSPMTVASCASPPLPPSSPSSTSFLALSQAPPELARNTAMSTPAAIAPPR